MNEHLSSYPAQQSHRDKLIFTPPNFLSPSPNPDWLLTRQIPLWYQCKNPVSTFPSSLLVIPRHHTKSETEPNRNHTQDRTTKPERDVSENLTKYQYQHIHQWKIRSMCRVGSDLIHALHRSRSKQTAAKLFPKSDTGERKNEEKSWCKRLGIIISLC